MEVEPCILPLHGAVQVKGIAQPVVGRASGGGEGNGRGKRGREGRGKRGGRVGGAREEGEGQDREVTGGNRYTIDTRLSLPSTRPRTSSVLIPN